jgi:hypothetical protein
MYQLLFGDDDDDDDDGVNISKFIILPPFIVGV